jgi:hypothetical protein
MPGGPVGPRGPGERRSHPVRTAVLTILACAVVIGGVTFAILATRNPPTGNHNRSDGGTSSPKPTSAGSTTPFYIGAWAGSAYQPTGRIEHWTIRLRFTTAGRPGTFVLPTLHCSGILRIASEGTTTVSLHEIVTRNNRDLCAPNGLIILSRTSKTQMEMGWSDASDAGNIATGFLHRALSNP